MAFSSNVRMWATATSTNAHNGRKIIFRYAKELSASFERACQPVRIIIAWTYQSESGQPMSEDRQRMNQLEDMLESVLKEDGFATLALVSTGEELREWTYYVKSEALWLGESTGGKPSMRAARLIRAWSFTGSFEAAPMMFRKSSLFCWHHLRDEFLHVGRKLTIPVSCLASCATGDGRLIESIVTDKLASAVAVVLKRFSSAGILRRFQCVGETSFARMLIHVSLIKLQTSSPESVSEERDFTID